MTLRLPFAPVFHGITGALVMIGILAVTLPEGAYVYLLILAAFVFNACRREIAGKPAPLSRPVASVLLLVAVGFLGVDYTQFSSQALPALAHFLMLIQVIKLYTTKQHQDYVLLYVVCLIQLGLASLMVFQLDFVVLFAAYLVLGSWALILFHIRSEHLRCQPDQPLPALPVTLRTLGATALLIGMLLVLTGGVFAVLPRFGSRYMRYPSLARGSVSGASDQIDLARTGRIAESDRVVMRVTVAGARPSGPLLLRGGALDRFEGRRWIRSQPPIAQSRRFHGFNHEYLVVPPGVRVADRLILRQTMVIEPGRSQMLYAVNRPHRFAIITGLSGGHLLRDYDHTYTYRGDPGKQLVYRVESVTPRAAARLADLPTRMPSAFVAQRYLQLPRGDAIDRRRLQQLLLQINGRARPTTDFQRVDAVRDHLQRSGGFAYTLANEREGQLEPLDEFLFERKSGHCEHYASALAVLLRAQRIPCRVVTGFLGKEYNPVGNYYVVRDKHAHAWVEVYFHGAGWVPFDATPSAVRGARTAWTRWQEMVDYVRLLWITRVISYDDYEQRGLYEALGKAGRRLMGQPTGTADGHGAAEGARPEEDAWPVVPVMLGLVGGALALVVIRRRRARRRPRPGVAPTAIRRLERRVRRLAGVRRVPGETLLELAARAGEAGLTGVDGFVTTYQAARYRGLPLTGPVRARLAEQLSAIRRAAP